METRIIAKVNETNILVSSDDNYVPIRPICKAIGIDFASQLEKLKNDKTLAATIQVNPTVGADGKNREMICIHKKYILAWILSINPSKVNPDSSEKVRQFRDMCYDSIYEHIFAFQEWQLEQNKIEIASLAKLSSLKDEMNKLKKEIQQEERLLAQIRSDRLDRQQGVLLFNTEE